jgi:hypothetical protein
MTGRPETDEYPPFYAGYVGNVPDGPVVRLMEEQLGDFRALLVEIGEERGDLRPVPGKWSVREVLGHVADTEQVMGFRALHFARGDSGALPGFEQDEWVEIAEFGEASVRELGERFVALRTANLLLLRGFDDTVGMRRGRASLGEFTVRAMAYILYGHAQHHMNVLRERYLA